MSGDAAVLSAAGAAVGRFLAMEVVGGGGRSFSEKSEVGRSAGRAMGEIGGSLARGEGVKGVFFVAPRRRGGCTCQRFP